MSGQKVHFNDHAGPICGGRLLLNTDWGMTKPEQLREVTCKRCVKKLREIGFAMQSFSDAVSDAIRKR